MRTKMKTRAITAACISALLSMAALSGCNSSSSSSKEKEPEQDPLRAETAQGPVEGFELGDMVAFRGIPYAAPPVRFAAPEPAVAREGVLKATEFVESCAQTSSASPFVEKSENEDCLHLNIYKPKTGDNLPVMVWIHGGAFETGSGGGTYDPVRLVAQGVVVVTINYRLGELGFLAHPALTAEDGNGSGDYGLMDQQEALRWVKANIDSFGGDPGNVTIFGESAGGLSVLSHVVSPQAEGLFQKAIIQSGAYSLDQRSLEKAEEGGEVFVEAVGCAEDDDVLACLRALPVKTILDNLGKSGSSTPNLRPDLLPMSVNASLRDGTFNHVPILTGNNHDEYTLFLAIAEMGGAAPIEADQVEARWAETFGPMWPLLKDSVTTYYPAAGVMEDPTRRFVGPIGDTAFHCSALKQARQLSRHVTTYAYEFDDPDALNILAPFEPSFPMGSAHAFEIQYVLGSEERLREQGATDAQIELANAMVQYWTAFARNGDPGQGEAGVAWPAFVFGENEIIRRLSTDEPEEITSAAFSADHRCAIWGADPDS